MLVNYIPTPRLSLSLSLSLSVYICGRALYSVANLFSLRSGLLFLLCSLFLFFVFVFLQVDGGALVRVFLSCVDV